MKSARPVGPPGPVIVSRQLAMILALTLMGSPARSGMVAETPGLHPGDTFPLASAMSGPSAAAASDIAFSHQFVRNEAASAGPGLIDGQSSTWGEIGSTPTAVALEDAPQTADVRELSEELATARFGGLWTIPERFLARPIDAPPSGRTLANASAWTGGDPEGLALAGQFLGSYLIRVEAGDPTSNALLASWITEAVLAPDGSLHSYALSSPILAIGAAMVPEPSSLDLILLAVLCLVTRYSLRGARGGGLREPGRRRESELAKGSDA